MVCSLFCLFLLLKFLRNNYNTILYISSYDQKVHSYILEDHYCNNAILDLGVIDPTLRIIKGGGLGGGGLALSRQSENNEVYGIKQEDKTIKVYPNTAYSYITVEANDFEGNIFSN